MNNLGILNDKIGDHEKGISFFSKAIDADRTKKNGYKNRGDCYLKSKMYREALGDYERLLLIEPYNEEYREKKVAIMKLMAEQTAENFMKNPGNPGIAQSGGGGYNW